MAEWYYALDGRTEGPVPIESLVRLLQGAIPTDTQVWREGFPNWAPANTLAEITVHFPARPPVAAAPVAVATAAPPAQAASEVSLKPLVVFRKCLSWRGRFTRAEYAMVLAIGGGVGMAIYMLTFVAAAVGGSDAALIGLGVSVLWMPFACALGIGGAVRRLNDLGKSSWLLLLLLVPLANLALVIYLLAVPSNADAVMPTRTPAGAIFILVLFGLLVLAWVAAAFAAPGLVGAAGQG